MMINKVYHLNISIRNWIDEAIGMNRNQVDLALSSKEADDIIVENVEEKRKRNRERSEGGPVCMLTHTIRQPKT